MQDTVDTNVFFKCDPAAFRKGIFRKEKKEDNLDMMRIAAVLAGCDYIEGIDGVAIDTAISVVREKRTLQASVAALLANRKARNDFLAKADDALHVFKYAWVHFVDSDTYKPTSLTEPRPKGRPRERAIGKQPDTLPINPVSSRCPATAPPSAHRLTILACARSCA